MIRATAVAVAVVAAGCVLAAQSAPPPGATPPNPYATTNRWGTLPDGRTWGGVSAIDIDRDGRSVWVAERCGGQTCIESPLAPILKLDRSGAVVASFGAGLFVVPHGIDVDDEGNVWVTDASDGVNAVRSKGHQVFKFSPDGKVLMVLGKAGMPGDAPGLFNRPSDVLVAPNGDVFVADGHGGDSNSRIVKFSRDGRFLATWGGKGTGPGQIDVPHSLAMDSRGRLFVADLNNFRVQAFSQDGKYLFDWKQFGMPGGLFIDRRDTIYVADSLSGSERHPGWVRGIRVGNAADGAVTAFIADRTPDANPITAAEGVAVDADGTVYGAIVPAQMLQKHVRR